MKKPLVSVVMPVYNSEKYLAEAIESILKQTYTNFEFIIIDDCSTDKSWKIISDFAKKDKRIRAFRNEKNLKIVKTRNKGFELCSDKSKYYAIFDSDDISLPKRLELEVKFLEEHEDYAVVGGHIFIINESGNITGKRKYLTKLKKIKKDILIKSPFAQPTVMIRKSALDVVGYYKSKGYDRARDYDLWVRLFNKFKIINLDKFLIKYRISSTQGKKTHLKETIKSTMQVQKKWLFKKKFFNISVLLNFVAECVLLLLPNKFVLWLFNKLRYKK